MSRPRRRTLASFAVVSVAVLAAAGLVGLGRATAPDPGAARARGYRDGTAAGYADGFQAGRAEGLQEGQALAETASAGLPAADRARVADAFNHGYRAGANSVFSGYDGGWSLGRPYVVVLAKGANGITYRIAARTQCPETPATSTSLLACQTGR
ncbi:MAG TPA: hypothetical protein VHM23_06175 [Actinomycetota bacterium]|jgi:hypothetical protein|nr:hypothetical protein [Actinomycetota bacterium]